MTVSGPSFDRAELPGLAMNACISVACLALSFVIYRTTREPEQPGTAYIVTNAVHHARRLPEQSKHSFYYETFSFMLSLRHLESHRLDLLSGWLFGYGQSALRCTGISPADFLTPTATTGDLGQRLSVVVSRVLGSVAERIDDVWMLAIPSYFGIEMNPLTLWFCYDTDGRCIVAVLEVHNTFSERHAYVLELNDGSARRAEGSGYEHRWTFPKQFHVSPFIERAGFYECSLVVPSVSPRHAHAGASFRLPRISLHVLTPDPAPRLKLSASQNVVAAVPLTSRNVCRTIARAPISMLLTSARILYHAYILHYLKRVDIYQRPAPHGDPALELNVAAVQNRVQDPAVPCGGLVWQAPGWADAWAQRRVEDFLARRARETGVAVELRPTNPFEAPTAFGSSSGDKKRLVVWYRSARAFSVMLETPSARHALYAGARADKVFAVSDENLFAQMFEMRSCESPASAYAAACMSVRRLMLPRTLRQACPTHHPLDDPFSVTLLIVLVWQCLGQYIERAAYQLVRARFRPGEEPWTNWKDFEAETKTSLRI